MRNKLKKADNLKSLLLVAVIILPVILGCSTFKKSLSRSNTAKFSPYAGSLSELLQSEIKGSLVSFKFQGSRDVAENFQGAKEAKGFTYMQDGAGVQVPVDGVIANFSSVSEAESAISKEAVINQASLTTKGNGKRFTAKNGAIVAWTNGTIFCFVKSSFAKPAGNFEDAAPF